MELHLIVSQVNLLVVSAIQMKNVLIVQMDSILKIIINVFNVILDQNCQNCNQFCQSCNHFKDDLYKCQSCLRGYYLINQECHQFNSIFNLAHNQVINIHLYQGILFNNRYGM
ncbi:unnamed protein product [Paramecium pentaurelia]|uniref:Uncharacterized protein n=1 Tax=Paramecium pentaurelia TaxID=43138 RepID=A0A8S1WFB9_9CILI|nr:unnamed protein product [Paramecium pentaurelia]